MRVKERVTVKSIEDDTVVLQVHVADASKCASCKGCSGAGENRTLRTKLVKDVKVGEELTVFVDGPSPVLAALLVFIYPLFVAFGAGGITWLITKSEEYSVTAGLIAVALAYLSLKLVDKYFQAKVTKCHE